MSSFCALENSLDFYQSNMHKCKKGLSQKIILRQPLLLRIGKKMRHKIPEKRIVKSFLRDRPVQYAIRTRCAGFEWEW